jgi:NADP-dependent aldehyde dehydrogenase
MFASAVSFSPLVLMGEPEGFLSFLSVGDLLMSFTPQGANLIDGNWVRSQNSFTSQPVSGAPQSFSVATEEQVHQACVAAEEAFVAYSQASRQQRADLLNMIADEIEARSEAITEIGTSETGLPAARLQGERGRTTGQLRLFAQHIMNGGYLDRRHDEALPDRHPLPRPDLKMVQRPLGPVAVFGASNFPLAFSTAGGDTASALAAGCSVVVKGHEAHPGTCEIVADAIRTAVKSTKMPAGVFSLVQGNARHVGQTLVQHPCIKAAGFTGSLRGGRALFDLCAQRPEPIPFFAEMGSINPVFLLPGALVQRAQAIGQSWAGSLTMGVGQFCTNPGIAVMLSGSDADAFVQASQETLSGISAQTMLTEGIANAYHQDCQRMQGVSGVKALLTSENLERSGSPYLLETTAANWLANPELSQEVFGPMGMVVRAESPEEMLQIADALEGQLTCTLQLEDSDIPAAQVLLPTLERKAGRLLVNGFPTGVEVCDSLVHGGPYPASTNFGATSVGTMAIRRFVRPVCYQNFPDALLPDDLSTN